MAHFMGNVVYRHCKMAIESELKKEKNSMRVIAEYDASEPGSGLKRIFYTVALNGTTDTDETLCVDVDIMVSEECRLSTRCRMRMGVRCMALRVPTQTTNTMKQRRKP